AGRVWSVLVVVVQPRLEGVAAFLLAAVAAGVGPPVGHGPVESLHFPVGLRPVRSGSLRGDRQRLARVPPQVGPVRATVVRQNSSDSDARHGEPLDRTMYYLDGSDGGIVVTDIAVRDAGVVVDDRVHEHIAELQAAVSIALLVLSGCSFLLVLIA